VLQVHVVHVPEEEPLAFVAPRPLNCLDELVCGQPRPLGLDPRPKQRLQLLALLIREVGQVGQSTELEPRPARCSFQSIAV